MDDFLKRLEQEHLDLNEKIGKLEVFTTGSIYQGLNPHQQQLLTIQLSAMKTYADCVYARLESLT